MSAQSGKVGQELRFQLLATDEDDDELTYSIFMDEEDAPKGAQLDEKTGEFTWTPT